MINWIIIICTSILIREIIFSINKRIYVEVEVDSSIKNNGSIYINLYDYKSKEILPRAIVKHKELEGVEEFKLNKKLITSLNYKEKIRYKYFNF